MLKFRKLEKYQKFPDSITLEDYMRHRNNEENTESIKESILDAAMDEFNEKGFKFTMDDISKHLGMSKKTIYTVFPGKEDLFFEMVDYAFASIKRSERLIKEDDKLDTVEKIRKIMIVLPDRYQNLNLNQFYYLQEKYPKIYKKLARKLETDWDATIDLLEQGMEEGKIKPISIPILKTMVEGTIEQFFSNSVLVDNNMSYEYGLNAMMTIIMDGIRM